MQPGKVRRSQQQQVGILPALIVISIIQAANLNSHISTIRWQGPMAWGQGSPGKRLVRGFPSSGFHTWAGTVWPKGVGGMSVARIFFGGGATFSKNFQKICKNLFKNLVKIFKKFSKKFSKKNFQKNFQKYSTKFQKIFLNCQKNFKKL